MAFRLLPVTTVLLLYMFTDVSHTTNSQPIVTTNKGEVQGSSYSVLGKNIDKFLGIPYAKPPLDDLRFKPPVDADPWEGVLDASRLPNSCMQLKDTFFGDFIGSTMWNANTNISEDCLYLSVWAPRTNRPFKDKAVMVFIYGGGFTTGTHTLDIYDPSHLVVEQDIVFVAMQYRLGALGFLALDTPEAPGNAGLWDQRMALEWVSKNIRYFGGDPQSVTLVSESAGSASVGHHLLCNVCSGLFHRAILQSGSPDAPWASLSREEMWNRSEKLAKISNCYREDDPSYMIQCMRGKDATFFSQNEYVMRGIAPVVDGVFLRKDPKELLRSGMFKKAPLLLGSNTNEMSFFLPYHSSVFDIKSQNLEISKEEYRQLLPSLFKFYPHYPYKLNQFGHDAIQYRYTNWLDPGDKVSFRKSLEQSAGDAFFVCPVNSLARAFAQRDVPVYYYRFDQRWTANPWPEWMGVLHGDEFWFTFGQALNDTHSFTAEEKELSRTMMRYWADFAKTGDPNKSPGQTAKNEWPRFHFDEQMYINLSTKAMTSRQTWGQGPRTQKCAFWDFYLPKLVSETSAASKAREKEFQSWKTQYISEWKSQFDEFLHKYQQQTTSKCNNNNNINNET